MGDRQATMKQGKAANEKDRKLTSARVCINGATIRDRQGDDKPSSHVFGRVVMVPDGGEQKTRKDKEPTGSQEVRGVQGAKGWQKRPRERAWHWQRGSVAQRGRSAGASHPGQTLGAGGAFARESDRVRGGGERTQKEAAWGLGGRRGGQTYASRVGRGRWRFGDQGRKEERRGAGEMMWDEVVDRAC